MGSFATPLSGLTAAQGQLQSVSNNLANINTDGYKDQTLTFADVFSADRRHERQWRPGADGIWRDGFLNRLRLY